MKPLRNAFVLLAVSLAAALPACGGGSSEELTIYSGRSENLVQPLLDRFAEETGVDIAVLYGDSADLAVQIDTEGDRSPADVFLSQSPGATGYLVGKDRLEPLSGDVTALVPEHFRGPDGLWVGLSGRVRVLVYNTGEVAADDLPGSVFDLTDAAYRGEVGVSPTNGSFQDFVTGMRELVGEGTTLDWLRGMVDNDARTYANNTAIVEAVQRGEIDYGLVNHYYNEQARAEDPDTPTANHFFDGGDPGTLVLVTALGLLDTAGDRKEDATRLVEFLLSQEAQEFFAQETFEYPLAAGVEPAVDLPPLEEIESARLDLSDLGGGLTKTRDLIRESGLERS